MPDFEIEGNPGAIRSKAVLMEQKGQLFYDTGDALAKIDVSGWTGRAADEFREAHDLEPERWTKAGNGFKRAAAGLTTYAGALEDVPPGRSGMAAGLVSMLRFLGGVVGTAILGVALRGDASGAAARHRAALWVFAGAFVLSGFASLLLPRGDRLRAR